MISNIKKNLVFILFIIHFVVSGIFLLLRWSQEEKVKEEKDLGEEEQITKKNIQTQLYIHSGISVAVCAAAIFYCIVQKEFLLFNLYKHGPMILHLVASVLVILILILNGNPDTSLWLSWVFQIVSLIVTIIQCVTRKFFSNNLTKMMTNPLGAAPAVDTVKAEVPTEVAPAATEKPPTEKQFGKKLLNFGKRKLK